MGKFVSGVRLEPLLPPRAQNMFRQPEIQPMQRQPKVRVDLFHHLFYNLTHVLLLVSWNRRLLAVYSLANDPKHPPDLQKPCVSAPKQLAFFLS